MGAREDLAVIVRADTSELASDLSRAAGLAKKFALDVEKAAPKADFGDSSAAAFSKAGRAASWAKNQFTGASSSLAGFAAKAAVASGAFLALETGLNGVSALLDQVKSSVNMAAELEQNTIAFEVMVGSAEKATSLLGDLRKFAAETPFSNKEVTAGARQLLAYGVAAEQIIPTLNLLGTISAGVKDPLSAMVYRYGTLITQGRAYAQDIHQFTNVGVRINPGLAKALGATEAEIHKLTEDGRIDINEVQAALIDLKNTQFAGLLERQSQSLKGSWEQLGDAFDRAKIKLGQVIVEEVGLKGAAKDMEAFAGKVENFIGGPGVRGAVHLLGDLAKGGAQIAYEFGKAGLSVASISLDGLTSASPQVAELARNTKDLIAGLQNFNLDDEQVAKFGFSVFKSIAYPIARAADWVQVDGKRYLNSFEENIIKPVDKWIDRLKEAKELFDKIWGAPDKAVDWVGRNGLAQDKWAAGKAVQADREFLADRGIAAPVFGGVLNKDDSLVPLAAELVRTAKAMEKPETNIFNPPWMGESKESTQFRYNHLRRMMEDSRFLTDVSGFKQFQPFRDQLLQAHHDFLLPFSANPGRDLPTLAEQLKAGQIPAFRPDYKPPAAPAPSLTNVQSLDERAELLESIFFAGLRASKMKAGFGKLYASIDKDEAAQTAINPFISTAGKAGTEVTRFPGPKAYLVELANKLNDQFFPLKHLNQTLSDLDAIRDLVPPEVYGKGRDNAIRDVAERLGLGGESHLPGAALVGSAEDARILAQFRAGNQGQTTEDLLKQIRDVLSRMEKTQVRIEQAPMPRPVEIRQ
jgi:hypothetical protein